MSARRGLGRLLPAGNVAAALYGTVLVSSVLVALGRDEEEPGFMIATVVGTALVFALAHAWATALGHTARTRRPVDPRDFAASVRHEWPMVQAALPASIALGLAAADLYSVNAGLWIAFAVNVALLVMWSAVLRRRTGGDLLQSALAGMAGGALGLLLVALKVFVH